MNSKTTNLINNLKKRQYWKALAVGCDPEFFLTNKKGKVIGAEKIIDKDNGIKINEANGYSLSYIGERKIIVDGVQAELNPGADTCRARIINTISAAFTQLEKTAKQEGVEIVLKDMLMPITKKELNSLSPECRQFGCSPSQNIYPQKILAENVDGSKVLHRTAGGHLHSSLNSNFFGPELKKIQENLDVIVKYYDYYIGNTLVLLDRHKGNKIRRKLYGRAGEFRQQPHGIEYRTPSNFWLKSNVLASFVFSLTRYATNLACEDILYNNGENIKNIEKIISPEKIQKAINDNSLTLAKQNFQKIIKIEQKINEKFKQKGATESFPLTEGSVKKILELSRTKCKEIVPKTDKEIINNWKNIKEGHSGGWESFCRK